VRIGWDLILDIDCKELEYSKIASDLLVHALRHQGVKSISVKFSGNHGFHIGVPFEALPSTVNGVPVTNLFPEGPRRIAAYLQEMIREFLVKKLLSKETINEIAAHVGKKASDLVKGNVFDPFSVVSIDTILIASRHLYRMPYCFNEKSGLVSVVIPPERILSFSRDEAKPKNVKPKLKFLPRENVENGEAKRLVVQAFDFKLPEDKKERVSLVVKQDFEPLADAVPEQYFPPCIQRISQGLEDGRKRSLFILMNFLNSVGWSYDDIEEYLTAWNKRNKELLRDVLILGHLRYHKANKKKVLPPNCTNKAYMIDMGICKPDSFCSKIKNPVNYAILKQKIAGSGQKKGKSPRKSKKQDTTTKSTKAL
jgi:hypothetical protein